MEVEIKKLLYIAHSEQRSAEARKIYDLVVKECNKWESAGGKEKAVIFKACALSYSALEEKNQNLRSQKWTKAFNVLEAHLKDPVGVELAETYGMLAIDFLQDPFTGAFAGEKKAALRKGKSYVDKAIKGVNEPYERARLLARKASLLRHLSKFEPRGKQTPDMLQVGWRCANKAVTTDKNEFTVLELAQCEYALARYEQTDLAYTQRLEQAEKLFKDDVLKESQLDILYLPSFYRYTYRQLDACEYYQSALKQLKHVRRIIKEAYVYAEAAIQLWYGEYPEPVVTKHLMNAQLLLEEALTDGYADARTIISLAVIKTILTDVESGCIILGELGLEGEGLDWEKTISLVLTLEPDSSDLITQGFAFGITQSSVLTSLGTFSARFLQNLPLAESLYRTAVRWNNKSPIALTNLARFLVRNDGDLAEAERLLQKAQNFADRRFKWWRVVLAELQEKKLTRQKPVNADGHNVLSVAKGADFKELKLRYQALAAESNPQKRGYGLEKLIYDLATLTFGTEFAKPSYKISQPHSALSQQIDGYLESGGDKYRIECKWLKDPVDHTDINNFAAKLDVVNVSGLFISMRGFTEGAIEAAARLKNEKAILLMDGEEVEELFLKFMNFNQALISKRQQFNFNSKVYYKLTQDSELLEGINE
ncbi:restriction endonuclease [Thalassomonas sp. RHCl1]|uniref:restriction endonuclease n=1 Tax=Thalassomonas sp. RHCl1 TaxID=2995320 RepID=UPI00248D3A18|nr:restriction endonuclease [Thalassomonas sp. RHCl1]